MNIKEFAKNHKKELIIGGVVISATVITILAIKYKKNPKVQLEEICKTMAKLANTPKDLPKPNWGPGFEIAEHWSEGGVNNMILTTFAPHMGELGELLINDSVTWANPDVPIDIILSYGSC